MNQREEDTKSLDKMISTIQNIKRNLKLLNDDQRNDTIHQASHEAIDERLARLKKDSEFFIGANSIIDDFLEAAGVTRIRFFKKDNLRKKKKPAHDRAKEDVVDARRVFCNIFMKVHPETLGRYLNLSRFTINVHKKRSVELLETDKKFQEYYKVMIKKLKLEVQ